MNEEIEVKAKDLGWAPKEDFRGDPEKWIDAETYVRRGEELMPLLKATTRKQSEKISVLEGKLNETTTLLAAATESIEALKETTSKAALDKVREQRVELKEALTNARSEGDIDKELEIQERLQETTEAIKVAEKPVVKRVEPPPDPNDFTKTPEWKEWVAANPWFGTDKRRTALSLGIADDLRSNGEKAVGKAFFEKVTEELNTMLGVKSPRDNASKVEGDSRSSAGGGGGNGSRKSYSDLPPEAKAACESASKRVVGKGRAFESMDAWRKNYVAKYYEGE